MGFSEPVQRARGRTRPIPPVTAGVRKRGKGGKLTPFVAIQEPLVLRMFGSGDNFPILLLVGENEDGGKIALSRCEPAQSNISLRRPAPGSTEFIVESAMIPISKLKPIGRTAVPFEESSLGFVITLPWPTATKVGEL